MAKEAEKKRVKKTITVQLVAQVECDEGAEKVGEQIATLARGPIITSIAQRAPSLDWSLESLELVLDSEGD